MENLNLKETLLNISTETLSMETNRNVLNYFITNDLSKMFGRDNINSDEIMKTVVNNAESGNAIGIDINGEEFTLSYSKENGVSFKSNTNPICFKITNKNGIMSNFNVYSNDNQVITEYQDVSISNDEYYNYKKSVVEADGHTTEYPLYRLRAVGAKIHGKECYELNCLGEAEKNKNVFQKLVNNLKKSNLYYIDAPDDMEPYEQIARVYEILESETEKAQTVRR